MGKRILLSSPIPFPPVSWWQMALSCGEVRLDIHERYQKMSLRNRYYLASPQGRQLMSIPLKKGRNQRVPNGEVWPDDTANWRIKHWRTIQSLYGRAPYFEFFAEELRDLFHPQSREVSLADWCRSGIELVAACMGASLSVRFTTDYRQEPPDDVRDIRSAFPDALQAPLPPVSYRQVFQERTGFIPDCSILDLLFCQGRQSVALLREGER